MSFFVYLIYAKKTKIPLYSFSNAFYFSGLVLSYLPGYFVASGKIDELIENVSYWGYDYELMFIYLVTAVLVPFSLLMGAHVAGRKYVLIKVRTNFNLRYKLLFIFCIIYITYYLFWLPSIPIFKLFSDGLGEAYQSRLRITHGFSYLDPPFVLRYWRNIVQNLVVFLFFIFFIKAFEKRQQRIFITPGFIIFFIFVAFCYGYNLEKAAILQFFIGCFFLTRIVNLNFDFYWKDVRRIISIKGVLWISTILILLVLISKYFMGADFGYAFSRIVRQDASNYLQIQYIRNSGYLGASGFDIGWLKLFGIQPADDTSVLAIQEMYSRELESGAGAAGGMFSTNIYFTVGWFFPIFVSVYVFSLGLIDKILINTIKSAVGINSKSVLISFYLILTSFFSLAALSNYKYIFSFTYIFSPGIIFVIIFLLVFLKLNLINKKYEPFNVSPNM